MKFEAVPSQISDAQLTFLQIYLTSIKREF